MRCTSASVWAKTLDSLESGYASSQCASDLTPCTQDTLTSLDRIATKATSILSSIEDLKGKFIRFNQETPASSALLKSVTAINLDSGTRPRRKRRVNIADEGIDNESQLSSEKFVHEKHADTRATLAAALKVCTI